MVYREPAGEPSGEDHPFEPGPTADDRWWQAFCAAVTGLASRGHGTGLIVGDAGKIADAATKGLR